MYIRSEKTNRKNDLSKSTTVKGVGKNLLLGYMVKLDKAKAIDIGSAITFDFVDLENNYQGGNISPGLNMRFRALHEFTSNLPLVSLSASQRKPSEQDPGIGKNTPDAIRKGVQTGIVNEMNGFIDYMKSEYEDLKIVVTGGDSNFFDYSLKNSIFVDLNLILKGLNRILEHNA